MKQKHYNLKSLDSEILDITAIDADTCKIYILTEKGYLYCYNLTQQQLQQLSITPLPLPILNNRELRHYGTHKYQIKCSTNGKFIAVYVDHGQFGVVINTQTLETVLHIDSQNYYEDTVSFSLAFAQFNSQDICIYRSDWNRLEAFNLTTNQLLTERYIAAYETEPPKHYLDYFHGALYVSPNNDYILDDGWIWHPVASPKVWSLSQWFKHNPFESEDGSSVQALCYRENWNAVMCWLDDQHVAIWNIELWDQEEFDLKPEPKNRSGIHLLSLAKTMWGDDYSANYWEMPEQTQQVFNLYADQNLLIIVGDENITTYAIADRILLNQINNSRPQKQHKSRQSLLSFANKTVYETSYI